MVCTLWLHCYTMHSLSLFTNSKLGTIVSLKNVKKDVTEMRKDTECGMGFEKWTDFAVGDHVQCYENIYEKRYL